MTQIDIGVEAFSVSIDTSGHQPIPRSPTVVATLSIPTPWPFYFVISGGQVGAVAINVLIQQVGKDGNGQTQNGVSYAMTFGSAVGRPVLSYSGVIHPQTLTDNVYQVSWYSASNGWVAATSVNIVAFQPALHTSSTPMVEGGQVMGALAQDFPLPAKWPALGSGMSVKLQDTNDGGDVLIVANLSDLELNKGYAGSAYWIRIKLTGSNGAPLPIQNPGWDQGVIAQQQLRWPGCPPMIVAGVNLPQPFGVTATVELMDPSTGLYMPKSTPWSMFYLQQQRVSPPPGPLIQSAMLVPPQDEKVSSLSNPVIFTHRDFALGTIYSIGFVGRPTGPDPSGSILMYLEDEFGQTFAYTAATIGAGPAMICGADRIVSTHHHTNTMGGHLDLLSGGSPSYLEGQSAVSLVSLFIPD